MSSSSRRSTSLTLDRALLDEAEELRVNITRAAEKGLAIELKAAREAKWREENREATVKSNAYVEEHGIPFANHRKF